MSQGYTVTKLTDLPVIHVVYEEPRNDIEDVNRRIAQDIAPLLEGVQGKLFRINDFSVIYDMRIFSLVMRVLPQELSGKPGTSSDPRLVTLFVGQGQALPLIIEGLDQKQYGHLKPKLFPSINEAIDYVHRKVAERAARDANTEG
jgi:hypothetical protein